VQLATWQMVHMPSCQLHISVNRTAQIYLELHFFVELHTKKSPGHAVWMEKQPDGTKIL